MISTLLSLHRYQKAVVIALMDTVLVVLALWIAFSLRLGEFYLPGGKQWWLFVCAPLVAVPIFIRLGLYRAVIRYIGHRAMSTIAYANALVAIAWSMLPFYLSNFFHWELFSPRSLPFIFWMVLCILVGGSRQMFRWFIAGTFRRKGDHFALIYGAGEAGYQLASSLSQSSDVRLLGFIDDNPTLKGQQIADLPVLGGADVIETLSGEYESLEVLLAMPGLTAPDRRRILQGLEQVDVIVRSIPSLGQIVLGKADLTSLNEVQLEDLLGRAPVEPDPELLAKSVKGRMVLVSGAGGSIGSELCRQLLMQHPDRLLLLEQNEFGLYQIEAELRQLKKHYRLDVELVPVLGSVTDAERMGRVLREFGVEVVFHAAAYKHVPIVEQNVIPAIRNNVLGTWELAHAAMTAGVNRFVLVSTDKAVRPTNIMGASKRLAEMVLQGLQQHSKNQSTRFVIVRFGNVLGSSGSVIPLFRKQIEQGGPLTVTDRRITRYFMTIPEAASLVIQAGAMGMGGELYVLDMGEPVKIDDLARRMIRLSGYRVQAEGELGIEIRYTGLRPGEKLYEELLIGDDVSISNHERIWVANEAGPDAIELDRLVMRVQELVEQQQVLGLRQLMFEQVNGFKPQCENQDLLDHVHPAHEQ
ncbi:polysaccharide biosynthesis protein [Motiliproteus coralliicola]|uniref:Polysaccharide biosynthesis protein n=1 Tax=Motiliproteus coralliicola TaxID=2283196 RepID=A0A369WP24_9GAMM|nr:nucleoside-diphosphate sugar epimerase/dehydratase [Motiliproteus coralliicola]RDE22973.1 polysaccharide biosynthesis protein [Motiliproteus coralliicola]